MSRRTIVVIVGALAVLLALTPFVPRGDDDHGAIRPSDQGKYGALRPARTAGFSTVTPAMRAEIDRVVAAGRALGRVSGKQSPERLAASLVRCADFDGQRYCLGSGWTEDTENQVRARVAAAARRAARTAGTVESTGDLGPEDALLRAARMSPAARAVADRAELTMAARSVAKVWLLRHQIEGVPLPAGFLADHPEARAAAPAAAPAARGGASQTPNTAMATPTTGSPSPTATRSATRSPTKSPTKSPSKSPSATPTKATVKTAKDYPGHSIILDPKRVAEQTRTYWCGPTAMQMIVWGWRHRRQRQNWWAHRLHTTTSGTRSPRWSGSSTSRPAGTASPTPARTSSSTSGTTTSRSGCC